MIYYSPEDLLLAQNLVAEGGFKRIFITGPVGSGKTTFCNKFCQNTNYRFLNLDVERDRYPTKSRSEVLTSLICGGGEDSYILEHWALLDTNCVSDKVNPNTLSVWVDHGEVLILLCPPRVDLALGYFDEFSNLDGKTVFSNPQTGTYIKQINS